MTEQQLKLELKKEERVLKLKQRINKVKELQKEFESEFNGRLIAFITTAFGVVAALFWQTAIKDTIAAFIPVEGIWAYEILVAFLVTFLAVFIIFFIPKLFKKNTVEN
jgi:uncharacterized membrane protein